MTTTIYTADRVLVTEPNVEIIHQGAVVVTDTLIEFVGRADDVGHLPVAATAARIDLGDVTLMPGLIDAHVHLAFDGGPDPAARMQAESDPQQVALMVRSARELLSVGVTTARDLGARGYTDVVVRDAIANGTIAGPRLLTAGAPLTSTGGHCWYMGGEADSLDEVRKMVRLHHKHKVDHIKVMSTGGFMTAGSAPWYPQFETEALRIIVDEAHRVGKRVAAHCHGTEGIRRAVAAGVDTLEHCSFVIEGGESQFDTAVADAIAASDSWVSPTINVRARDFDPERFGVRIAGLKAAGARIITSTDSGIDNTPHFAFPQSLPLYVEFGMTTAEVLRSTTVLAAEALGLAGVTGQLAAGCEADLIAVRGNPLDDIAATADLEYVVARGRRFIPDVLPEIPPLPEGLVPMNKRHSFTQLNHEEPSHV
ncbi:amidohydrolase family protein [Propionibacteriaceae bacterium G1746]|uniref:metal-dependent hydrolase family protein n=1 Tax=Aestuariimicrobium sp. G57 TaxID=3418485 RepID=UPI003C1558EE